MEEAIYYGKTLKDALKSAERLLEKRIDELNALNVFPVPDGDTGINMFLTLQAATASLDNLNTNSVAEMAPKLARGALLGARGNSGVILSQIFRGMAKVLETKDYFTAFDFAKALHNASETAYRSITKPVEGTILTVIREAAEAAGRQISNNGNLKHTITTVTDQARNTVSRTPDLLPQLKEAGVVDAGGKGLYYVFLGMKNSISEEISHFKGDDRRKTGRPASAAGNNHRYGFDLQFLITGENLDINEIRENISEMGESVLVVGDEKITRVHIHTKEPQAVIDYCTAKGELKDLIRQNMDEQVASFRSSNGKMQNSDVANTPRKLISK